MPSRAPKLVGDALSNLFANVRFVLSSARMVGSGTFARPFYKSLLLGNLASAWCRTGNLGVAMPLIESFNHREIEDLLAPWKFRAGHWQVVAGRHQLQQDYGLIPAAWVMIAREMN